MLWRILKNRGILISLDLILIAGLSIGAAYLDIHIGAEGVGNGPIDYNRPYFLGALVNYTEVLSALDSNFNSGMFYEGAIPTTRAIYSAFFITDILQEPFRYNLSEILRSGAFQGVDGGFYFNLDDTPEYSFTSYYILSTIYRMGGSSSLLALFDTASAYTYLIDCYNSSTGGFKLSKNDTSSGNIYINWMVIYSLKVLGDISPEMKEQNVKFIGEHYDTEDIQSVFSAVFSLKMLGCNISESIDLDILKGKISDYVNSDDFYARYWGLAVSDLVGWEVSSLLSDREAYVNETLMRLDRELDGFRDLQNINILLGIIAFIHDFMDYGAIIPGSEF